MLATFAQLFLLQIHVRVRPSFDSFLSRFIVLHVSSSTDIYCPTLDGWHQETAAGHLRLSKMSSWLYARMKQFTGSSNDERYATEDGNRRSWLMPMQCIHRSRKYPLFQSRDVANPYRGSDKLSISRTSSPYDMSSKDSRISSEASSSMMAHTLTGSRASPG